MELIRFVRPNNVCNCLWEEIVLRGHRFSGAVADISVSAGLQEVPVLVACPVQLLAACSIRSTWSAQGFVPWYGNSGIVVVILILINWMLVWVFDSGFRFYVRLRVWLISIVHEKWSILLHDVLNTDFGLGLQFYNMCILNLCLNWLHRRMGIFLRA